MISGKMKLLTAIVSATALIATPALASKPHKKVGSGPDPHASRAQRAYDSNAIYGWEGQYRGWDPDANIRFQLMRDQNLK
jgi:hypothetical protein